MSKSVKARGTGRTGYLSGWTYGGRFYHTIGNRQRQRINAKNKGSTPPTYLLADLKTGQPMERNLSANGITEWYLDKGVAKTRGKKYCKDKHFARYYQDPRAAITGGVGNISNNVPSNNALMTVCTIGESYSSCEENYCQDISTKKILYNMGIFSDDIVNVVDTTRSEPADVSSPIRPTEHQPTTPVFNDFEDDEKVQEQEPEFNKIIYKGNENNDLQTYGIFGIAPYKYMGFVYKNIKPFNLKPGDKIAFDLIRVNDKDITLEIAFAITTKMGGHIIDHQAEDWHINVRKEYPYTIVVTNGTPAITPRGNNVLGDYELEYNIDKGFEFDGTRGLIIRIKAMGDFQSDDTENKVFRGYSPKDSSGYFVKQFFDHDNSSGIVFSSRKENIAGFQLKIKK
jgi:hypothetical protein